MQYAIKPFLIHCIFSGCIQNSLLVVKTKSSQTYTVYCFLPLFSVIQFRLRNPQYIVDNNQKNMSKLEIMALTQMTVEISILSVSPLWRIGILIGRYTFPWSWLVICPNNPHQSIPRKMVQHCKTVLNLKPLTWKKYAISHAKVVIWKLGNYPRSVCVLNFVL